MKHHLMHIGIVCLFAVLPLFSLLTDGLPVTHDGQDHVVRIANFYQSMAEGNLVPRWGANLNWGFGHPVLMFLYPLPSYAASVFRTFGFDFVDSTKLVFAATYILSMVMFYLWSSRQWGTLAGMVGTVAYGYAPYRFVDLYVRGALGEHTAFLFPPMILLGLWLLAHERRHPRTAAVCIAWGAAGLLLSHNAVSLMMFPVVTLYAYYLSGTLKSGRRYLLTAGAMMAIGFALAAFFWIPALIEGKYTLRYIVTSGEVLERFVPATAFLRSAWNYGGGNEFSKELGILHWLGILVVLWAVLRKRVTGNARPLAWGLLGILALTLFLMIAPSAAVWKAVPLLQTFQFPWRFLSVAVLVSAALAAQSVGLLPPRVRVVAGIALIVGMLVLSIPMWRPKAYKVYNPEFFTGIYAGTTDTGESSPIWSVRFMERFPAGPVELISGEAAYRQVQRNTTRREYVVTARTPVRMVENTLYFPGWELWIDGVKTVPQFQDPDYRGLMTFTLEPGEHTVRFIFTDTKVRRITVIISAITAISCMIWFGKRLIL